jgi:hypothetical protein
MTDALRWMEQGTAPLAVLTAWLTGRPALPEPYSAFGLPDLPPWL